MEQTTAYRNTPLNVRVAGAIGYRASADFTSYHVFLTWR